MKFFITMLLVSMFVFGLMFAASDSPYFPWLNMLALLMILVIGACLNMMVRR